MGENFHMAKQGHHWLLPSQHLCQTALVLELEARPPLFAPFSASSFLALALASCEWLHWFSRSLRLFGCHDSRHFAGPELPAGGVSSNLCPFFLLYAAWVRSRAERPSVSYTKVVMEVAWTGHNLQFTKTN